MALHMSVFVEEEVRPLVAAGLLTLGQRLTKRASVCFTDGELAVKPAPLNHEHKIAWDSALPRLQEAHTAMHCPAPPLARASEGIPMHVVACPKCKIQCAAKSLKLIPFNLEVKIRCPGCKVASESRHWRCSCNLNWHMCCRHVPIIPPYTHSLPNKRVGKKSGVKLIRPRTTPVTLN